MGERPRPEPSPSPVVGAGPARAPSQSGELCQSRPCGPWAVLAGAARAWTQGPSHLPVFGSGDRVPTAPGVTKPSRCCGPGSVSPCCSAWQRGQCLSQGARGLCILTASHGDPPRTWLFSLARGIATGGGIQLRTVLCVPVLPPRRDTTARNLAGLKQTPAAAALPCGVVTLHFHAWLLSTEKSSFTPEIPRCAKVEIRMVIPAMPPRAGGATPNPALAPRTAPLHHESVKPPVPRWAPLPPSPHQRGGLNGKTMPKNGKTTPPGHLLHPKGAWVREPGLAPKVKAKLIVQTPPVPGSRTTGRRCAAAYIFFPNLQDQGEIQDPPISRRRRGWGLRGLQLPSELALGLQTPAHLPAPEPPPRRGIPALG